MIAEDFREVAHCGFRFMVRTRVGVQGQRETQLGIRGSRPNPMAVVGLFLLPQGVPVGMLEIRGIGQPLDPPPIPGAFMLFLGSDSEGRFGHECYSCGRYWRSDGLPTRWPMTCPYCGIRDSAHSFVTKAQRRYLDECCRTLDRALFADVVGEFEVDLDAAADAAMKGVRPPDFYYSEQSQQTRFTCSACRSWNDILGRYGYCSNCGTRNDLQQFESLVGATRQRINRESSFDECLRTLVSGFDSTAQQLTKQLIDHVPLVAARRARLTGRSFHKFTACVEDFRSFFGFDLLHGGDADDAAFGHMMFARRHVHEHNGGVVDADYMKESGDASVRLGELLRESKENVTRLSGLVLRMARNLHQGFHELVPPVEAAVARGRERGGSQELP